MKASQRAIRIVVPDRFRHRVYPLRHRIGAVSGPPPSLDGERLAAVVGRRFGGVPLAVAHAPMVGYKSDSVYRVWVRLQRARYRTLVFKNARLDDVAYPAIQGFPGRPGLPEWSVLSTLDAPLSDHVPGVIDALELEPGLHYQYLLEDLAWTNRPVLNDYDVELAVQRLPTVHEALAEWAAELGYTPRNDFGMTGSDAFLQFVEEALERFLEASEDRRIASFLARWDEVSAHYRSVEAAQRVPSRLIHGDFNRKNTFLGVDDPAGMRLVDWEWMGVGPPHADLASIMKRSPWGQQRAAIREYFADDEAMDHDAHWDVYLWCRLGRSLLDAALHANQNVAGRGHTSGDVAEHLGRAAEVLAAATHVPIWSPGIGTPSEVATVHRAKTGLPRVTIALPVYNGARFLEETIESLLAQTFSDFELKISDNASTDETPEIVARFEARDPRVISHRHSTNVGAHYNYNGMVEGVESEFFKWAADDDLYKPTYLERCLDCLDAHPEAVLAYCQAVDIDEEGRLIHDRPLNFDLGAPSPVARFRTYLGARNACLPIFGLYRTEALQASGLLGHYAASDRVLLAELALLGTWVEVPEPLFLHREHGGRSVHRFPNPRNRGSWFTPGRTRPDPVYWKRFDGYRRAIHRVHLSASEKVQVYALLAKWVVARSPDLALDLVTIARDRVSGPRAGGVPGD